MPIEYKNNAMTIKSRMNSAISNFMRETCFEISSMTKTNSEDRVKTGQTKGSYEYKVESSSTKVDGYVGSNFKNAIYEEFGTGEFAKKGGRSGYWVFVKGHENGSGNAKSYSLKEAKKVMAILRKKGLDAYYTKGKTPNEPLKRAFDYTKPAIESRLAQVLKGLGG